jgi:branched-chain amino acid transport system ATP-binding protein
MLSVKNIETWYDLIRALHGISFEIKEGAIVALLGSNGAGKTTTLKTIMRLLDDDQPEKGTIVFMGKRIDRMDTEEIVRLGISYVPEGREVFPELTVMENILMGAYTRKDRRGIQEDIEAVLKQFPILRERKNQEAGHLSGGEQQMLAIGRALMAKPKMLLLDEPLLGLSPAYMDIVINGTKAIRDSKGISIIVTEQYARPVMPIIDYGYIMENGSNVLSGTKEDLLDNPDVKSAYFGV